MTRGTMMYTLCTSSTVVGESVTVAVDHRKARIELIAVQNAVAIGVGILKIGDQVAIAVDGKSVGVVVACLDGVADAVAVAS